MAIWRGSKKLYQLEYPKNFDQDREYSNKGKQLFPKSTNHRRWPPHFLSFPKKRKRKYIHTHSIAYTPQESFKASFLESREIINALYQPLSGMIRYSTAMYNNNRPIRFVHAYFNSTAIQASYFTTTSRAIRARVKFIYSDTSMMAADCFFVVSSCRFLRK